jgi:ribulose-phosphate 3-epimerase
LVKIAPSLLAADFSRLAEEVTRVQDAGADLLHIDVMDGHFVPNISIGPMIVKSLRAHTSLPFDVHLMVEEPSRFIIPYSDAGADIITVHVEAFHSLYRTVRSIKDAGRRVGITLNPPTPLCSIEYLLEDLDLILIMSVDPGFGGQSFIPQILPKIKTARQMIEAKGLSVEIAVDGGVNAKTARQVVAAGADILIMGSAIFRADDPNEAIREIRQILTR